MPIPFVGALLSGGWSFLTSPKFWKIMVVVAAVAAAYFIIDAVKDNGRLQAELDIAIEEHDKAMDEITALKKEAVRQGRILANLETGKVALQKELASAYASLREAEKEAADEKFTACLDRNMPDGYAARLFVLQGVRSDNNTGATAAPVPATNPPGSNNN